MIGIIILNIIIILLVLIVIYKNKNNNLESKEMIERLGRFETSINTTIFNFQNSLSSVMNEKFNREIEFLDRRLNMISDNLNNRIDENFKKSNETFVQITNRLSVIDNAQKKIDSLSSDIISLQNVLTDKKSRGIFGEINLKNIMSNVFGENNDKIYQMQYTFMNGRTVDCVLFAPQPLGTIGIDSKFPLENYKLMVDKTLSIDQRITAEKQFKSDFKKHIDAIAEKYIISDITSDQAIMFLPAEAIFAEVNAYHPDLIEYSYRKRVWICSPTTLMSTLTVVQVVINNMEKDKYSSVIHRELNRLGDDFKRYKERWDKLSRSVKSVNDDIEKIHITTDKISQKFEDINKVNLIEEKKNI